MFEVKMQVRVKVGLSRKETYEKTASLIRVFIKQNNKGMNGDHYKKMFSYYSFSNFHPIEYNGFYPKGNTYTIEVRGLHRELLDLKRYKGLETKDLIVVDVNAGPCFYQGEGYLESETPVYFGTKPIKTAEYEEEVKHRLRENIIYRYVKSPLATCDDLGVLREKVVKDIKIDPRVITIPFERKQIHNGNALLYHCVHVKVAFHDDPVAREVERVIYGGGLGRNTSNGFGMMKPSRGAI